jgi:hypothetical protein
MKSSAFPGPLAEQFAAEGFAVLPNLYTPAEVAALLRCVERAPVGGPNFRRSQEVFAITSARPRRVMHLEFTSAELPDGLQWRERRKLLKEAE